MVSNAHLQHIGSANLLTSWYEFSIFWDLYIAAIYGILYLCFVAYPIVFSQIRGWSPGISGLAFTGIGVGSFLVIGAEPLIRRMINAHKVDPETGKVPPEAMVSVVCIAAVLVPLGELWFAWTCVPVTTHWIWPILAGTPTITSRTATASTLPAPWLEIPWYGL